MRRNPTVTLTLILTSTITVNMIGCIYFRGECVAAQSFRLPDMLENESVLSLSSGRSHFAAVSQHGQLYTWGCGADGRLGHGRS